MDTPMDASIERWFCALVFFLVLEVVTSILRYGVRIFLVKRLGIDDLAAFVTLCISFAFFGVLTHILRSTRGEEAWELTVGVLFYNTDLALANILLYGLGTMCLKVTLGLFLLRILVLRWHRIVIYSVMSVVVAYGIFWFFFNLFECGNPRNFAPDVLEAKCFSTVTIDGIAYTHAVICAASDIIFGVLPIFYLRTANLDRRTKISVGAILGLGSAGCVCTLIRIWWIHYLTVPKLDFFRTVAGISVMSFAELSIGLTCLALTTLKPLFRRDFFHPRHNRTNPDNSNGASGRGSEGAMMRYRADADADPESQRTRPGGFYELEIKGDDDDLGFSPAKPTLTVHEWDRGTSAEKAHMSTSMDSEVLSAASD